MSERQRANHEHSAVWVSPRSGDTLNGPFVSPAVIFTNTPGADR